MSIDALMRDRARRYGDGHVTVEARAPRQMGKTEAQARLTSPPATPINASLETLRVPAGKPVTQHLRDLMAFWSPDSAAHQLARACLDEIDRASRRAAACTRAAHDTADTLAAELET